MDPHSRPASMYSMPPHSRPASQANIEQINPDYDKALQLGVMNAARNSQDYDKALHLGVMNAARNSQNGTMFRNRSLSEPKQDDLFNRGSMGASDIPPLVQWPLRRASTHKELFSTRHSPNPHSRPSIHNQKKNSIIVNRSVQHSIPVSHKPPHGAPDINSLLNNMRSPLDDGFVPKFAVSKSSRKASKTHKANALPPHMQPGVSRTHSERGLHRVNNGSHHQNGWQNVADYSRTSVAMGAHMPNSASIAIGAHQIPRTSCLSRFSNSIDTRGTHITGRASQQCANIVTVVDDIIGNSTHDMQLYE